MSKRNWSFVAIGLGLMAVFVLLTLSPKRQTDVITVGAVLPLSGRSAAYGNWIQEALQLVEEETNATGGIQSQPLKIIYEDDQGKPSSAASAIQKLANIDKVPLVYGSWVSSCVLAMAPIAERSGTVLMAEAISPKIREAGDYTFRFNLDARIALAQLITFAAAQEHRMIAILYINNDFGLDQAEVFKQGMEEYDHLIVLNEGYDSSATDFRSTLTKIKTLEADAVFIPGYLEIATILKQARELGLDAQFYSSFPFENSNILNIASNAAENVVYPFFFDAESTNPLMLTYQENYERRYGRPSEGFAALGYSGMKLLVEVMRDVGADADRIKDALYKIDNYPTAFGPVSFDEKGDIEIPVLIKTVRNGEFVTWNKAEE